MARDNESTMKWKLDIADLKKGMQDARNQIKLANAEFKNATAGMGKWSDSATGVAAKAEQLGKTLDSQKTILEDLKKQYEIVSAEMGETSPQAQRLKIQIENQEAACKNTESQLAQYNSRLEELQEEERLSQQPISKLNEEINNQEQELADLKRQYANSIVGNNPEEANKLAREIEELSTELADNKRKMNDAEKAADDLDNSIDDAADTAESAANGGFTVLKGALANLISEGIQQAIGFVSDLVDDAIAASDALQKFESTMGFAGYDDSAIQQARQDVQDYADSTVYDLETIANTTAQLAANGIDDYTGLTQAAGNLNAVAGGNADTFNSLAMMLTQTAGAGKLTTENWNQLADAIPGASGVLQDALREAGAYTGDFREAMANGEITAEEFNAALMQLGTDPVAVEAATSVSTFEGAMGNLEATVVNGLMSIYEQIGSENITGFITSISNGIEAVIPYIKEAVQWVLDNKDGIIAALAGIAAGIAAVTAIQGIMTMIGAFKSFFTIVKGGQGIVAAFNAVMGLNPFVLIAGAVIGLVTALVVLFNTNEEFRNKVIEVWGNVKEFVGGAVDAIKVFFTETIPNAITSMVTWFAQIPEKVGTFLSNAIAKVKAWAAQMGASALAAARGFLNNVITFISQVPTRIGAFLSSAISRVASWAGQLASRGRAAAQSLLNAVVGTVREIPSRVADVGMNLVRGIWNGISNGLGWIKGKISGWVGNVTSFIKNLFGIHSPSTVMRDQVGKYLAQGIAVGFGDEMPAVMRSMQKDMGGMVDGLKSDVSFAANGIANGGYAGASASGAGATTGGGVGVQNVIFNQTINSPNAIDRLSIYRDTKSILFTAKGGLQHV